MAPRRSVALAVVLVLGAAALTSARPGGGNHPPAPAKFSGSGGKAPTTSMKAPMPTMQDAGRLGVVGALVATANTCTVCPNGQSSCLADASKGCNDKIQFTCPGCFLWREIAECKTDTKIVPAYCSDARGYYYTPVFKGKAWLIEPTAPGKIGIESLLTGDADVANLWDQAWKDATAGADRRTQIASKDIAIVVNSMKARTQHSLHIHVGKSLDTFKSCISQFKPPTSGWWEEVAHGCLGLRWFSPPSQAPPGAITRVWYTRITAPERKSINSFWDKGLKIAQLNVANDQDTGFAVVGDPSDPNASYLVIFNGQGVNDHMLIDQE
jgi:hypothetical protein